MDGEAFFLGAGLLGRAGNEASQTYSTFIAYLAYIAPTMIFNDIWDMDEFKVLSLFTFSQ